jgi:ubiquitin carboxyl-terminal hydrolase 5/13
MSEEGLDLCLKCFSGVCSNEIFNHKLIHMQQNNHLVYLNIKQVKKIPNEENISEMSKVTKLAIGKPGGADFSGEEYEMQLTVRCLACNITIDYQKNVKNN